MSSKPAPNLAPRLVSREAAAAYCGISENTFGGLVEPCVPVVSIGTRRLFDVRQLDEWIDRQHIAPNSPEGWVVDDRPHKRRKDRPQQG